MSIYKPLTEEGFPKGEYRMRCYDVNESFRDFYFVGEGDYIQCRLYDLLDEFAAVSVAIKVA